MSRSMFDDLESAPAVGMEAADARTLRLSAHPLTQDGLQSLVRYQEAYLAHAEQPAVGHDGLGAAHELGLKASGLEVKKVELGLSLLRAYSGKRWTVRKLRTRLAELERQSDAVSTGKARRAREEMARVEDLDPLARRYGQETIDLLNEHEERLVDLHARMQKAHSRV